LRRHAEVVKSQIELERQTPQVVVAQVFVVVPVNSLEPAFVTAGAPSTVATS
jgi:hypothetical protein